MKKIANKINRVKNFTRSFSNLVTWVINSFPTKKSFFHYGINSAIEYPCNITNPQMVSIEENVRVRYGINIINSPNEKVIIKKYSLIAPNVTIVTNSHRPTVTIPKILLGATHINDKSGDVVIEEDCWIGTGVIILAGVTIGRGSVVSAGAVVSHDVPPYSLVVGIPARVVKKIFSIQQILEHEKILYREEERMLEGDWRDILDEQENENKILGTSEGLTEDAKRRIKILKEKIFFVEPY